MQINIIILFFCLLSPHIIHASTYLTQHGITWSFDGDYTTGQFVNGDYWVVDSGDGVSITGISPGYISTPRAMNGSMVNPAISSAQGYDASIGTYDASKNVGIGISSGTPLILRSNQSLVSTISNITPGGDYPVISYVKTAAVLTCLASAPPSGSFRPGISSTTKTLHNKSSINYSLLRSLPVPSGTTRPNINNFAGYLQQTWLTHDGTFQGRLMHPSDGIPDNYYYTPYFGTAALMLHLDYTNEEKDPLLINFIQLGIDIYSYIEAGGVDQYGALGWVPNGGHSSGRKWPILFAGIMLDYAPMKNIGQKSGDYLYSGGHGPGNPPSDYIHFGEDGQTFYVAQSDVDITNGGTWNPDTRSAPNYPYTTAMIGMPEWGIVYSIAQERSDSSWAAEYRAVCAGQQSWAGFILAARMTSGGMVLWNHKSLFDYIDRHMAITGGSPDPFGYVVDRQGAGGRPSGFIGEMWDAYRYNLPGTKYKLKSITQDQQ
jgi:hypothetical protein